MCSGSARWARSRSSMRTTRGSPRSAPSGRGARAKAQSLHSAEELLAGVRDVDWRVRHESVPRLLARWHDDDRTLLTILELAEHDPVWQVRSAAIMKLLSFDSDSVPVAARRALDDASEEVRWSANYVLFQLGHSDSLQPPWRD